MSPAGHAGLRFHYPPGRPARRGRAV